MNRPIRPKQPRLWTRRSMLMALAGGSLAAPACTFRDFFSWNGGKPVLFGYGTAPVFDRRYKTIRVKIFKDHTFWSVVPVPNLEMELTEFLVQHIEQKTPYKVDSGDADTEISGMILSFYQVALNYTQLNEIRVVQTTLTCAVRWKDLRTGKSLSGPARRPVEPPPPAGLLPGQQDPLNGAAMALPGSLQQMETSAAPIPPSNTQATMAPSQTSPAPNTGNPTLGQTNMPGAGGGPPMAAAANAMAAMLDSVLVQSIAYYRPEIGQSLATAQQDNCNFMCQQIVNMMETAW